MLASFFGGGRGRRKKTEETAAYFLLIKLCERSDEPRRLDAGLLFQEHDPRGILPEGARQTEDAEKYFVRCKLGFFFFFFFGCASDSLRALRARIYTARKQNSLIRSFVQLTKAAEEGCSSLPRCRIKCEGAKPPEVSGRPQDTTS